MKLRPHMIRTQKVEVAFENPENAFDCQNQLAEVCKNKLLPALDKLFNEKVGQKRIISIDKLHVDAGTLDKENWENRLVETVIDQLGRHLNEEVIDKNTGSIEEVEEMGEEQTHDSGGFVKGSDVSITEKDKDADILLYFLQYGVLPWYASVQSQLELQQMFIRSMNEHDVKQKVVALILEDELAFERLVYHTEEEYVFTLIWNEDGGGGEPTLKGLKKRWNRIFARLLLTPSKQRSIFFKAAYQVLVKKNEHKATIENITFAIMALLERKELEKLIELTENPVNPPFIQEERQIVRCIEEYKAAWQNELKTGNKSSEETTNKKPGKRSGQVVFDEENPVFITNAGLVLLHPFLTNLFSNVGYTEKNQWISEEVHQRSLVLSQYLVTGSGEYQEFDLFLNKILTGYPLEAPLSVDLELSAFEKGEAEDLLQSVVSHWKALKNTSVQGLQNTFLQREGKMVKKESGWLLRVDQKAFDILLDKIPWGFSSFKTPWMDEILSAEWA